MRFVQFIERVQNIAQKYGKIVVGWEEIARACLLPSTIVQFWTTNGQGAELARRAAEQGALLIMSPASKAYLIMKYDIYAGFCHGSRRRGPWLRRSLDRFLSPSSSE